MPDGLKACVSTLVYPDEMRGARFAYRFGASDKGYFYSLSTSSISEISFSDSAPERISGISIEPMTIKISDRENKLSFSLEGEKVKKVWLEKYYMDDEVKEHEERFYMDFLNPVSPLRMDKRMTDFEEEDVRVAVIYGPINHFGDVEAESGGFFDGKETSSFVESDSLTNKVSFVTEGGGFSLPLRANIYDELQAAEQRFGV